jgi:hypothetical protein
MFVKIMKPLPRLLTLLGEPELQLHLKPDLLLSAALAAVQSPADKHQHAVQWLQC